MLAMKQAIIRNFLTKVKGGKQTGLLISKTQTTITLKHTTYPNVRS
jgi:hypothetical protein